MFKKITFPKNNCTDTVEIEFKDNINILKSTEYLSKFDVLDELPEYTLLNNSAQANGDFVEFELFDGERTYFLTMYLLNKVYEFYNDLDVDQKLADFYIPRPIKYKNYESIFINKSNEFDLSSEEVSEKPENEEESKYLELKGKISVLEDEIEKSKLSDMLEEDLTKIEYEYESLVRQSSEYDNFNLKIKEVDERRSNLGVITKLDFNLFESDLKALNKELQIKEEQITKLSNPKEGFEYEQDKPKNSLMLMVLFLALDVVLTVAISFTAGFQGAVIGAVIAVVILIWYFIPKHTESSHHSQPKVTKKDFAMEFDLISKAKDDLLKLFGCMSEAEFYEKKAQLQACDVELKQLHIASEKLFSNIDANTANQKQELLSKINKIKEKYTEEIKNAKLTSEQYLKKRRDLDMLKMERIRLESTLKGKINLNTISKQTIKIADDLSKVKDELGLSDVSVEGTKLKSNSFEHLYFVCILNEILSSISKKSIFSIILNDPFAFITDFSKAESIIKFLSQKGQSIISSNHTDYDKFGYVINQIIKDENSDKTTQSSSVNTSNLSSFE